MRAVKKGRRRVNYTNVFLLVIAVCIFLGSLFFAYQVIFNRGVKTPKELKENISVVQEIGKGKTISKKDGKVTIVIHYPKIGKKNIDQLIEDSVQQMMDGFLIDTNSKPEKTYIYVSYDTTIVNGQYASVAFKLDTTTDLKSVQPSIYKTMTFDVDKDEIVTFDSLFQNKYLEKMAAIVRKEFRNNDLYQDQINNTTFVENTSAKPENYQHFLLQNDKIVFYFNEATLLGNGMDKDITLSIPVSNLSYYLKNSYLSTPEILPTMNQGSTDRYIDPNKPMVALTFDDGPSKYTVDILEKLKEYSSAATFYVVGSRIDSHSEILKQEVEYGNEIGNHTYNHGYLTKTDANGIRTAIDDVVNVVTKYASTTVDTVRPTFGAYNQLVRDTSPYPLIMWSVDTLDWKTRDADKTYNAVMNGVKDGDIILMHDIYEATRDAAVRMIPDLIAQGYQLVTVSELFEYKGIILEPGLVYNSGAKKGY